MGMDWLYGPRERGLEGGAQVFLRSMTLDIEALRDVERDLTATARGATDLGGNPSVEASYWIDLQQIPVTEIASLSVADKDRLELRFSASGAPAPALSPRTVSVTVASRGAIVTVFAGPEAANVAGMLRRVTIDTLNRLGENRVTREWVARGLPLVPPVLSALAWAWLSLSTHLPLPAHVLFLVALVPVAVWGYREAQSRAIGYQTSIAASLHYRGESRTETDRRRADRHANIRVAAGSALVTLLITVIGALATAYFTGWFDDDGVRSCERAVERVDIDLTDPQRALLLEECSR